MCMFTHPVVHFQFDFCWYICEARYLFLHFSILNKTFIIDFCSLRSTRRSSSLPRTLASRHTNYHRYFYSLFRLFFCITCLAIGCVWCVSKFTGTSMTVFIFLSLHHSIHFTFSFSLAVGGKYEWPGGPAAISLGGLFTRAPSYHYWGWGGVPQ